MVILTAHLLISSRKSFVALSVIELFRIKPNTFVLEIGRGRLVPASGCSFFSTKYEWIIFFDAVVAVAVVVAVVVVDVVVWDEEEEEEEEEEEKEEE